MSANQNGGQALETEGLPVSAAADALMLVTAPAFYLSLLLLREQCAYRVNVEAYLSALKKPEGK